MTPVFIPWTNHAVFETNRQGILTDEVLAWIAAEFGHQYFSLTPDGLLGGSRLSFLRPEHALMFKLRWGGQ